MRKDSERLERLAKIGEMNVREENKKMVLEFDHLNGINGLAAATRIGYLGLLTHLLVFCEARKKAFKHLKGEEIREFVSMLKERKINTQDYDGFGKRKKIINLTQGTLNIYMQGIKRFFKFVYKTGRDNPKVIRDAGLRQRIVEFSLTSADLPTEEEIQAIIDVSPHPHYKAIIAVAYDSGMRINDILDIKVKDLIIGENEVRLRFYIRKTKKHLLYGLGSSVGYLMNWYNLHPTKEPEDFLFCTMATNHRGRRMGYANIYRVVKQLAKKAGVSPKKNVSCHTFRHCATKRDKPHYSDEELRVLRGWSRTSTMPLRYAPISADEVFKKKQVLEGKITPEPEKKVIDARNCPRCKNTVTPDSAYCCICGHLLNNQPSELSGIMAENPSIMKQIIGEVTKNVERRMKYQKLADERFKVMTNC